MNQDNVALITGAAGGIGKSVLSELVSSGWKVAAGDLDTSEITADENIEPIDLDVTSEESVHGAVHGALQRFGRLDLAVTAAGIQRHGPAENLAWEDWHAVMNVNLHGVFTCMREAGKVMLSAGRGSIVNISSVSAARGCRGRIAYAASKAAVESITRTAAVEWAPRGVRVNAIAPGYVDTEMIRRPVSEGRIDLEPILSHVPMGRLAQPSEIASAIRYLASESASFITGQCIYVDGGFIADYGIPWPTLPS